MSRAVVSLRLVAAASPAQAFLVVWAAVQVSQAMVRAPNPVVAYLRLDAGCGTGGAGSGDASNAGAAVAAGENTTVMASGVGWLGGAAWRAIRASASAKQTWTATEPISGEPTCGGRLPGRTTSSRGPADRTGGPKAKPASASLDVIFVIL